MRAVPVFERGERARASDFAALAAAVRELLERHGLAHVVYTRQPARVYFAVAGSCVARGGAEGGAEGLVVEWLWQCGEQVQLLPGGRVGQLDEALVLAGSRGGYTGLHGELALRRHGHGMLFELEATGVEYQAAAWLRGDVAEDGSVDEELLHGAGLAGCVASAANVRGQVQRGWQMWVQPQYPALVYRSLGGDVQGYGSLALLPCAECVQVVGSVSGGYYPGDDYMADFVRVYHCWTARLDVYGQLWMGAMNHM